MKILIGVGIIVPLLGCAQAPVQVAPSTATSSDSPWRILRDSPVPYDRAWDVVVTTIGLRFDSAFIINNKETGRIQTEWKEKRIGIFIPNPPARVQFLSRFESKAPVRISLKVEKEEFSLALGRWIKVGRDTVLEDEIAADLESKLQRFGPN